MKTTFLIVRLQQLLILLPMSLLGLNVAAHPGNTDLNGGHYMGNSYHCHMPGCEAPDTFDRLGRDSFFTDHSEREQYFNRDDWSFEEDFDQDCQSTRQEMLILTSRINVTYTNPRNCQVRVGEWLDEYTGKVFTVATQVDVDHIIPLMYAHTHGGDMWPPGRKIQFANDPENLIVVEKERFAAKQIEAQIDIYPGKNIIANTPKPGRGLPISMI